MVLPLARDLQDDQMWTKRFDAMSAHCPPSSTDLEQRTVDNTGVAVLKRKTLFDSKAVVAHMFLNMKMPSEGRALLFIKRQDR